MQNTSKISTETLRKTFPFFSEKTCKAYFGENTVIPLPEICARTDIPFPEKISIMCHPSISDESSVIYLLCNLYTATRLNKQWGESTEELIVKKYLDKEMSKEDVLQEAFKSFAKAKIVDTPHQWLVTYMLYACVCATAANASSFAEKIPLVTKEDQERIQQCIRDSFMTEFIV